MLVSLYCGSYTSLLYLYWKLLSYHIYSQVTYWHVHSQSSYMISITYTCSK